jgi:hypothetical protein
MKSNSTYAFQVIAVVLSITAADTAVALRAIAVDSCGTVGLSNKLFNETAARREALQNCQRNGGGNCEVRAILLWNCAAVATEAGRQCNGVRQLSVAVADTPEEAERRAVSECSLRGGKRCARTHLLCDGRP